MASVLFFSLFTFTPTTAKEDIVDRVNVTILINGEAVVFSDHQPIIVDGRTLVPVHEMFKILNYCTIWGERYMSDPIVVFMGNENTVVMRYGRSTFTTNNVTHTLDVTIQTINGITMIPIRFVLESVGYTVDWDESSRTVWVSTRNFTSISANKNYYELQKYTVTFINTLESATGTLPSPISFQLGEIITLPPNSGLHDSHAFFDGWRINESSIPFFRGDRAIFTADTTIVAGWIWLGGWIDF